MPKRTVTVLKQRSLEVRRLIIEAACRSKSVHVGSSLSCVDLLVALYFDVLRIDKRNWGKRDIFVLSKAHAAMALYAVLTARGFLSHKEFENYFLDKGSLPAHLDRFSAAGIEVSAGALGHGFNIALGMALGYKRKKDKRKVYVLIGDGESQEGSIWEGAMFGSHLGLDNLTAIMDYNNLQGYGVPTQICSFEPVAEKWKAFGWQPYVIDGHNYRQIQSVFRKAHRGKPKIIIARTVKGKGVSFMENQMKWHYYVVTEEYKRQALKELCNL